MKTRSARLAKTRVQQPTVQSSDRRRTTRLAAQADMDRRVRWASRVQFFSPPPDEDGDSVMEDSEYVPSEDGMDHDEGTVDEDSDTETAYVGDVDSVMGDDSVAAIGDESEGPRTPTRSGPYNFGSVILTPDKNRPRASGDRQAVGNDDAKVHSRYPSLNGNRFNHNNPVAAPTSAGKGKNPAYFQALPDPPYPPSAGKSKNRAYVLLPSNQRGLGRPARDENIPGPSNRPSTPPARRGHQANLHRQRVQVPADPLVTLGPPSMWNPVRWYRGEHGNFVRDGSLPPEYYGAEHLKKVQPPRDDAVPQPAAKLVRCDTEPLEDPPAAKLLEEPAPQPQARPKRKTKAQAAAEVDVRTLRRSIRIRDLKK